MTMYCPVIIDYSDPEKPVYEQSIHNQQRCIQARFPMFEDVFAYNNGVITGIHTSFTCENFTVAQVLFFITQIAASSHNSSIARFTDPNVLIKTINTAKWV